jgi:hypothetical protein
VSFLPTFERERLGGEGQEEIAGTRLKMHSWSSFKCKYRRENEIHGHRLIGKIKTATRQFFAIEWIFMLWNLRHLCGGLFVG